MTAPAVRDSRWLELEQKVALRELKPLRPGKPAPTVARVATGAGWLIDALPAMAPAFEQLRAPIDRLEALERQLLELVAFSAPATWSSSRRPLLRILRAARREIRALDRRPLLGERS